jgi:aspartyl-tRNA(Asn)/glutamyl-tRNA(Gln) amidotransferase subunit C
MTVRHPCQNTSGILTRADNRVFCASSSVANRLAAWYKARPVMNFTDDQLRHVAKLARLHVPDDQLHRLAGQLASILAYVDRIGEVDVAAVEPMAHPLPVQNVLREDVARPGLPLDEVLKNAPDVDGPFFRVPKVIGGDEDA